MIFVKKKKGAFLVHFECGSNARKGRWVGYIRK